MSLSDGKRLRVEQFVRPLYAGLDGEQTFHCVARVLSRVEEIRGDLELDPEVLELLVICHGVIPRLGSLARNGRLDLFFRSLDLEADVSLRVRAGLDRLFNAPRAAEELVVYDATLLDEVGIAATSRRLLHAGRRRIPLDRALERLDPGPPQERFKTSGGAALGGDLRRRAVEWIRELRQSVEEEEGLR